MAEPARPRLARPRLGTRTRMTHPCPPADPRIVRSMVASAEAIKDWTALDRVAEPIGAAVSAVTRRGPLNDVLSGTHLGHPLHPALVVAPLGSWLSASVLDLLGGCRARPAATRLTGLGIICAVPAALAGASDWVDTAGGERRVGVVHAAGNSAALVLFAGSWLARHRGRHAKGVALSAVGVLAAAGSAWLGGHLTYALGVGVDTTAFQNVPQGWVDVASDDEVVEGGLLPAHAGGTPVVLTRIDGRVLALADRCTHRGGPLHKGELSDGCITCPWHGSRFALVDGSVRHGPATRPQLTPQVRVVDGRVQLRHPAESRTLRTNPVS